MTPETLAEIRRRFTAMSPYELNCDPPTHDMVEAIIELLDHVDALEKRIADFDEATRFIHPDDPVLTKPVVLPFPRVKPTTPLTPCVGTPIIGEAVDDGRTGFIDPTEDL